MKTCDELVIDARHEINHKGFTKPTVTKNEVLLMVLSRLTVGKWAKNLVY